MNAPQYAVAILLLGIVGCSKKDEAPSDSGNFSSAITRPIEGTYDCTVVTTDVVTYPPGSYTTTTTQQVVTITKKGNDEIWFKQPANPDAVPYTYFPNGVAPEAFHYSFHRYGAQQTEGLVGFNQTDSLTFSLSIKGSARYNNQYGRGKRRL